MLGFSGSLIYNEVNEVRLSQPSAGECCEIFLVDQYSVMLAGPLRTRRVEEEKSKFLKTQEEVRKFWKVSPHV